MKKTIISSMMAIAFVSLALITACNKNDTGVASDDSFGYIESTAFMVPAMDAGITDVTEPTMECKMEMIPGLDMAKVMNKPEKGTPHKGDFMPGHPGMFDFRRVFRHLTLTDTQLTAIKPLTEAYRECVKTAALVLHESEKAIIDARNLERQGVIDSVKAGTMTKADARERLRQIMKETRIALRDNPARIEFKTASCNCLQTLFAGIEAILTPEQLAGWETWKAQLKNDCINP